MFSIAVSLTAINKTLLLVGLLISLLSFYYFMRLHVLLSLKKSVYNIRKDSSNKWSINCKDSEYENVLVSTTSFVSNYLIILNFIDMADNKKYTALLTPDSVKEDVFRRMKVMIRTMKDQTN